MRQRTFASALILSITLLTGCGDGKKEDSQVSETRMDDIDSLEGTISDDMINTDETTDAGPFEQAPSVGPVPKAEDKNSGEDNAAVPEPSKPEPVNLPPLIIYD